MNIKVILLVSVLTAHGSSEHKSLIYFQPDAHLKKFAQNQAQYRNEILTFAGGIILTAYCLNVALWAFNQNNLFDYLNSSLFNS